jgi:hypothetical protein
MASASLSAVDVSTGTPGATMTNLVGERINEIILSNWDISVILAFAGSRLRACLTYLQHEDSVVPWPSERVTRIRAGLHWEVEVSVALIATTMSNSGSPSYCLPLTTPSRAAWFPHPLQWSRQY